MRMLMTKSNCLWFDDMGCQGSTSKQQGVSVM